MRMGRHLWPALFIALPKSAVHAHRIRFRNRIWGGTGSMAILKRALVVAVAGIAVRGLGLALVAAEGREAATSIIGTASAAEAQSSTQAAYDDSGFRLGEATLTPSERAGREIWYKSTAGNARFHTYVFQQRVGVLIDWFRV